MEKSVCNAFSLHPSLRPAKAEVNPFGKWATSDYQTPYRDSGSHVQIECEMTGKVSKPGHSLLQNQRCPPTDYSLDIVSTLSGA